MKRKRFKERKMTLDEGIVLQKRMAAYMWSKAEFTDINMNGIIKDYKNLGRDIIVALQDFKCEHCGAKDITVHHFVGRKNKFFIDKKRYFVQRHYFANLGVLCCECHSFFHDKETPNNMPISEDRLDRVRNRFITQEDLEK